MKYFSMFSGIGGFELGIQRAYSNQQSTEIEQDRQGRNGNTYEARMDVLSTGGPSPLCVGFSEVNKYAIQVYEQHFKGHKNYGDATRIIPEELPDFDFLVGGFPCQAFSIAGKRKGFDEARGTLFFDIARILSVKRPRCLLLENVKGLLSHDNGKTFQTIIGILTDIGYHVQWQVLNSKDFGVPQNRERVFIVGHLGGECSREVFPIQQVGMATENPAVCLTQRGYGSQRNGTYVDTNSSTADGKNPPQEGDKSDDPNGIRRATYTDDMRIRRLTPTECERLQGFPDGWTEILSDSQRYKCLGNAVTVNVIEKIMKEIIF